MDREFAWCRRPDLPSGVMATQPALDRLFMVQVHAGQFNPGDSVCSLLTLRVTTCVEAAEHIRLDTVASAPLLNRPSR